MDSIKFKTNCGEMSLHDLVSGMKPFIRETALQAMSGNISSQVDLLFKEIERIDKTVEKLQISAKSHSDLMAASKLRIEILEQASDVGMIDTVQKENEPTSKVDKLRIQVSELLTKEPVGGPDLWKKLQPLNLSIFDECFKIKTAPQDIDLCGSVLKSSDSNAFETMLDDEVHGYVRTIDAGEIVEATQKHGQLHGLSRVIENSQVHITLNYLGCELAYLHYNRESCETERGG